MTGESEFVRYRRAVDLARRGLGWEDICAQVQISRALAWKAVKDEQKRADMSALRRRLDERKAQRAATPPVLRDGQGLLPPLARKP